MCLARKMLILASSLAGASAISASYVAYTHQNIEKAKVEEQVTNVTPAEDKYKDIDPGAAFA